MQIRKYATVLISLLFRKILYLGTNETALFIKSFKISNTVKY